MRIRLMPRTVDMPRDLRITIHRDAIVEIGERARL
jgi:hypothetical protein